ncbi:hypothetical protein V1286_006064 [Bradyrhizobium algeriense]|uniref:Uncharacterized protein n=1 Tax=Bradyrhizobium algeriense TaxID=634784 RepID=A0ABU8BJ23_9BRAD
MRYELRQEGNNFIHVETGQSAGYVTPLENGRGFSVHRDLTEINERDQIGVVKSIQEALPKLSYYYLKHLPKWVRRRDGQFGGDAGYVMCTVYSKWSFYGVFEVKQQEDGQWVATRCTEKLLRDGEEVTFPTAEVARYVVDRHKRDGIANYPALDDGYSWGN